MAGYIGSKASVVSSGAERKKTFTITGATTSLTGLNYTVGKVHVFQNGVRLVDSTDYTATNGTTITLTVAAQSGDNVVVISQAAFQVADALLTSGGTMTGALVANAGVTVDTMTLDAATLTATGDLNFNVAGNMILDADGGNIFFNDNNTTFGKMQNSSSDFVIESSVQDKDLIFKGNDGGSVITAIKIDMSAGGAVNMPIQPAFLAQGDGQTGFPLSTATTIDFETEVFDQGANFSSNTFTAPVTGRYLFACMVYTRNLDIGTNYYQLQLVTSNRTYTAGLGTSGYDADMLYFPFSVSILADMDFDDTAVLKMDVGSGGANQLIVESQTYFSGYLVA